ncbi:aspartate aminotransferase family protein [Neorhizobium sp. P12A]|uniref:aspartate aminotransferase family protein n=1 Tax=Neorhizobium sp. P12A TaxID=2268027 RepID=UPI0011EC1156|nr:aspartate aminotransferase family protein [Neorhizobium sp. P12A]KAA0697846.1 aspartate aminotransferase family protein [Neorhizobium sp. P12A]
MTMANAFGAADFARLSEEEQAMIARRERVLGPAYRLFYERPVHFVRGEGVWLYDSHGQAYLDAYNNVASVGHGNPKVLDAISRQAATLNTHTRYLHDGILTYAESLTATCPAELSQAMFTCTGSEANDLAVRIARSYTGGTGIIVTSHAYHGVTSTVAEFSPSLGPSVDLGVHVRTVAAANPNLPADAIEADFAQGVEAAIADLKRHGLKPAMLIVDTIFSSDGVIAEPPGFLKSAVAAIREAGGIFVADEVQPGFGRTGDAMWGFLRHGIVPDLVTIGKPMGNGYPMAGLIARPEIIADFGRNARYFNTFGGNPVAAAAGQAVLDVISEQGLIANARTVGTYLREKLAEYVNRSPLIASVRGAGLFIGMDIVEDGKPSAQAAARIVNGLRERHVLISASGPQANVLKIRPPLVFSRANADTFIDALHAALADMS